MVYLSIIIYLFEGRKMPKNVVLIFIDTLNRVGAARKLPKTMKWMEV
jgi:hypothetical protein